MVLRVCKWPGFAIDICGRQGGAEVVLSKSGKC
jgi:hypothetical protein